MRSLSLGLPLGRRRRPARHDPAPSRLSYRLQRLALTPMWRRLLRFGLPLGTLALIAAVVLSDDARREALWSWADGVKTSIEDRPEFMVRMMSVEGASPAVAQQVRAAAQVTYPISSFKLDLPAMHAAIVALDPVSRADLRVRSGGILEVRVTERMPVAVWRRDDGLELVDRDGVRVARIRARTERPELPLIAGRGAAGKVPEALALLAAARPLEKRVRGLVRVGQRRWDLVLDRSQRIMLPADAPVRALEQVMALDEAQDIFDRDVTVVDMRNPRRPTVRLGHDAAAGLHHATQEKLGAPPE